MTEIKKPKTLREYLLDGGVKGRYFRSDIEPTIDGMPYGGYCIEYIITGHGVKYGVDICINGIGVRDECAGVRYLSEHLSDPELTPEEVNELRSSFNERYKNWISRPDELAMS